MATLQLHPSSLFDSLHASFSRIYSPRRLSLLRHRRRCYSASSTASSLSSTCNQSRGAKSPPFSKSDLRSATWINNWREPCFRSLQKWPRAALDYRPAVSSDDDEFGTSRSTGSSTMSRIVDKLRKFGYIDDSEEVKERPLPEKGSVEDIFYTEDGMLPDARGGLSFDLNEKVRFPWEKPSDEENAASLKKKRSKTALAELTLPPKELRRLRHLSIRMKSNTKIKAAGVTKDIVDLIHEKWKTEEVVRLKCEGPPALNMKRMHEILERKTGGLVIWRSGTSISLYRGVTYDVPQPMKRQYQVSQTASFDSSKEPPNYPAKSSRQLGRSNHIEGFDDSLTVKVDNGKAPNVPPESEYDIEIDKLLDDLGPRYTDWPGSGPLPVDADLLPGVVPGYKPPFRILPYGVRPNLGRKEMTDLLRLARRLPPHFALGRSRQHQGLATAMVRLWEKSSIAKIALKRGVQLTSSERMAEDIKKITGAVLISRNKDYIVFYRGKDFLPLEVTAALLERERLAKALQDEEEHARLKASSLVVSSIESVEEPGTTGTLGETLEANARWAKNIDDDHVNKMMRAAEMARHANLVRKLEKKLFLAERKLTKASKALAKVEEFLKPSEHVKDPESITDEERFMFRKLGLRMKAFLLLGRRGVFDGTIENMHLHWKYRELVKIIVKAKKFVQVKNVALALEAESGGILVSVDKISKGFAIIVYRGRDYQRPSLLRPKNLLTKRKALARSIELQRREVHFVLAQKRYGLVWHQFPPNFAVEQRSRLALLLRLHRGVTGAHPPKFGKAREELLPPSAAAEDKKAEVGWKVAPKALNKHISNLQKRVEQLRSELVQMDNVKDNGDEELYAKLDSAYSTEDEDIEDEDDEAYLDTLNRSVAVDNDEVDNINDEETAKDKYAAYLDTCLRALDSDSDDDRETQSINYDDHDINVDEDDAYDELKEDGSQDYLHSSMRSLTMQRTEQH